MRHIFVETNWVVDYAAPSPFKVPGAVELLERARDGEFELHVPAVCLMEAQRPLRRRYEPRPTGDAVRQFVKWAKAENAISANDEEAVRRALDKFESQIRNELEKLADTLDAPRREPVLETFALNSSMLERTAALSTQDLNLEPFDLAVLAAILERCTELLQQGEDDLAFCELDKDLQPWDRAGNPKQPLASLYDSAYLWVYGDFSLEHPAKPTGWPNN